MKRDRKTDLWATPDGRRLLADRELLLATVAAVVRQRDRLVDLLPDLPKGESMALWRARTLVAPRDATAAAAMLDRYYCLDWAYLEAERRRIPLPGMVDSHAIGQRRWALEWAVVFAGPYHGQPRDWEEIDLST
jgi:hypothetical protein